jgi:lipoyl(octanoyl) transferase
VLNYVDLGLIEYGYALEIQYKLHQKRQAGEIEDTLLLLEHEPVLTLGTRGDYSNIYLPKELLEKQGIEIFEVNRGGDVTYHGPGQIVGYAIMDIKALGGDLKEFVHKMEQSIIGLLKDKYAIDAYREEKKYTGVWVDDKKIAAIGIEAKKWVSMHGFAFNVNTNLEHFKLINPCGLSKEVTSVESLAGKKEDIGALKPLLAAYFAKEHQMEFKKVSINDLLKEDNI